VADRFENDENKSQGQLQEVFDLLREKFPQQALRQRWLRRQVSSIIYLYSTPSYSIVTSL
jgi:hypothetical protein